MSIIKTGSEDFVEHKEEYIMLFKHLDEISDSDH